MSFLIVKAYWELVLFDLYLARNDFPALHNKVRSYPLNRKRASAERVDQVCAAVDMACIWYWKEVRCLQRAGATACLLKQFGIPAQMVIGARQVPFKAHAWVEVNNRVVNDKPYTAELYLILERC
jgi:transglutaminase superfamily protein